MYYKVLKAIWITSLFGSYASGAYIMIWEHTFIVSPEKD